MAPGRASRGRHRTGAAAGGGEAGGTCRRASGMTVLPAPGRSVNGGVLARGVAGVEAGRLMPGGMPGCRVCGTLYGFRIPGESPAAGDVPPGRSDRGPMGMFFSPGSVREAQGSGARHKRGEVTRS